MQRQRRKQRDQAAARQTLRQQRIGGAQPVRQNGMRRALSLPAQRTVLPPLRQPPLRARGAVVEQHQARSAIYGQDRLGDVFGQRRNVVGAQLPGERYPLAAQHAQRAHRLAVHDGNAFARDGVAPVKADLPGTGEADGTVAQHGEKAFERFLVALRG